jgi:hypothetical protein
VGTSSPLRYSIQLTLYVSARRTLTGRRVCLYQGTQTPRDVYSKQALEWALEIRNSFPPARGFRSFGGETVTWMSMNNSPGGLRWVIRRLLTNTGEVATPFHSA